MMTETMGLILEIIVIFCFWMTWWRIGQMEKRMVSLMEKFIELGRAVHETAWSQSIVEGEAEHKAEEEKEKQENA
jgi:hypothetical protein